MTEYTETIEPPKLQIVGEILDENPAEDTTYHTVLELWKETLAGGREVRKRRIAPVWCVSIVSQYPQLKIQDMVEFHSRYHDKIEELEDIVLQEIDGDKDSLNASTKAEDCEFNYRHYLNIIQLWQTAIVLWEMAWDPADENAHIELAAMSEVHKFFFNGTGFLAQLDAIGLEVSEEDRAAIAAAVREVAGEHE